MHPEIISSFINHDIRSIHIGSAVLQTIRDLSLCLYLLYSAEAELADQQSGFLQFIAEGYQSVLHSLLGAINIQVIRIHRCYNGYIRIQFQKASVVFVGLHHAKPSSAAPEVSVVVYGNATQKRIAPITAMTQDMCNH